MRSPLEFIRRNIIAVLLLLIVSLAANLAQPMRMDDATFLDTFTALGNDLWAWAQEYWVTWSGRVVPHGLFMVLLSFSPELVNFLNAVLITFSLVLSCIWAVRDREESVLTESILLAWMAFSFYVLTPVGILDVTVFWKTASVLYIWGFAAMLLALIPFMTEIGYGPFGRSGAKKGTLRNYIYLLPALYCAGFEPSGSFYFAFGGIMILLACAKHHVPRNGLISWAVTSAAFFFFLSAPGNMVRFREESLFWFPNYGLLRFTDKLLLGTSYTLGALLHEMYIPMLLISLVIFFLMIVRKRGVVLTLSAFIPLLYYGLYRFASESPFYAFVYSDVYGFYTSMNWFATFLGMFAMILTALLILIGIHDAPDIVNALFYCGAIAEQVVMGFTPTVAVSISRSTFFSRELLMIPLCALSLEFFDEMKNGTLCKFFKKGLINE